jgi:putative hydrolase of the HAD superfamily
MGGVLLNYDPPTFIRHYVTTEAEVEFLNQALFASELWRLLDLGNISQASAQNIWQSKLPQYADVIESIMANWHTYMTPIEPMYNLVKTLRNYKTYLLSNASDRFTAYKHTLPVMDGYVISYEHHVCKPDAGLYEILFEKYKLNPAECFFIDDHEENVEAGKKLGMDGVVFDALRGAGVEI